MKDLPIAPNSCKRKPLLKVSAAAAGFILLSYSAVVFHLALHPHVLSADDGKLLDVARTEGGASGSNPENSPPAAQDCPLCTMQSIPCIEPARFIALILEVPTVHSAWQRGHTTAPFQLWPTYLQAPSQSPPEA